MEMSTIEQNDKLADAKLQGQAQFDSIREMVSELRGVEGALNDTESEALIDALDATRRCIQEDALSVDVRTNWYAPCSGSADTKPAEYRILLCTGGPAVQLIGELSECGEPETARMEVQDWFQPWTEYRPLVAAGNYDSEPILLAYAQCFYFGE
jgi:hypothetical protein